MLLIIVVMKASFHSAMNANSVLTNSFITALLVVSPKKINILYIMTILKKVFYVFYDFDQYYDTMKMRLCMLFLRVST